MNQYQIDGWHVLQLGLSIGATASAVTAAVWGLWKLGKRWWYSTFGLRKAQAAILDQLACIVSLAYVEDLLGVPRFILGDERFYSLPGGWVGIQYKDDAVNLLSITITDSRLWYSTSGMTLEMIDVKLGYDSFAQANEQFDGERLWIGARHAGLLPALPLRGCRWRLSTILAIAQHARRREVRRGRRPLLLRHICGSRCRWGRARPIEDNRQHTDDPVTNRQHR